MAERLSKRNTKSKTTKKDAVVEEIARLRDDLKNAQIQSRAFAVEVGERTRNSILRIAGIIVLVISILGFANLRHAVESYFEELEVAEVLEHAMPAMAKSEAIDRRASALEARLERLADKYTREIARANTAASPGIDPSRGGDATAVGVVWYGEVSWPTLRSYHFGCRQPRNLVSNQCFSAIHKFCQSEHGGRAGLSQEVGPGGAMVACLN